MIQGQENAIFLAASAAAADLRNEKDELQCCIRYAGLLFLKMFFLKNSKFLHPISLTNFSLLRILSKKLPRKRDF